MINLDYSFGQDKKLMNELYTNSLNLENLETYLHSSYINVVFGADKTKYPIMLFGLTLDTLEKEILDKRETQFLNARKICLRDVPLTEDLNKLEEGVTYRVHITQSFEDCPELCDIYLFKVIE